jgi:hypothetical protein
MSNILPKIGERWKYKEFFILEINDEAWNYGSEKHPAMGFKGVVVQIINSGENSYHYWWKKETASGDFYKNIEYWFKLEGQEKPIDDLQQNS